MTTPTPLTPLLYKRSERGEACPGPNHYHWKGLVLGKSKVGILADEDRASPAHNHSVLQVRGTDTSAGRVQERIPHHCDTHTHRLQALDNKGLKMTSCDPHVITSRDPLNDSLFVGRRLWSSSEAGVGGAALVCLPDDTGKTRSPSTRLPPPVLTRTKSDSGSA